MKHLFVPYKLAVKLKKKGFDEPCLKLYQDDIMITGHDGGMESQEMVKEIYGGILAPLYQQVLDWFREKRQIHIKIVRDGGWWIFSAHNMDNEDEDSPEDIHKTTDLGYEDDYIDGLNSAIEKSLKLIS